MIEDILAVPGDTPMPDQEKKATRSKTVELTPITHKRLAYQSIFEERSQGAIVEDALISYFEHHKIPADPYTKK
jgi:hypothetical protein